MFMKHVREQRLDLTNSLLNCKMEGGLVFDHVVKMHGYVLRLGTLDAPWADDIFIDQILALLPSSFDASVADYNARHLNETL